MTPTQETANGVPADLDAPQSGSPGGNQRQYVIFHIEDEMFALPLSEVQEIVRVPDVVRVPLSPHALRGLANLRGMVMPVLSLRDVFGFEARANDDATRVVVLDQGQPIGIIVDRMANVVTVEPDRIEPAASIRSTIDTDVLTGMIKSQDGRSIVMILDSARLVEVEFSRLGQDRAASTGGAVGAEAQVSRPAEEKVLLAVDEDQLVSFEVANQEYAFPIETVQEIVQLPDHITQVPNVPRHVLGVITLRNRLLPLVSLREMFGLASDELSEANKVVVVSLGHEGRFSVGVVMDSVSEVLRVGRSLIEPVPSFLHDGAERGEISAICRLQNGNRLVSVLSVEALFDTADIRRIAEEERGAMKEISNYATGGRDPSAVDEEQFVVFRLLDEEYGVSIDAVQEILRVPEELTRIPKAPSFIEGVINLRGVVLPVIDQRRRFDLVGIERNDRQRIMVFTIHGVRTGFVVDSVSEVMRIPASAIGAAPNLSGEQRRLIRRVANLEKQKRMILLLDVVELLDIEETATLRSAA